MCPRRPSTSRPVVASQTRTVLSSPAEARRRPSGLKATPRTFPVCRKVWTELAGRRIPQFHGPVEAGRGQPPAVRAERQRADGVAMRGQGAEQLPCFRVPEAQALLPGAARRQAPPVGAERHGDRMVFVSGEGVQEVDGSSSPRPSPPRRFPPRGVGRRRTERHGIRRPELANGVARSSEHLLAGRRQVPDLHQPVRAGGGQVLAVGVEGDADDRLGRAPGTPG